MDVDKIDNYIRCPFDPNICTFIARKWWREFQVIKQPALFWTIAANRDWAIEMLECDRFKKNDKFMGSLLGVISGAFSPQFHGHEDIRSNPRLMEYLRNGVDEEIPGHCIPIAGTSMMDSWNSVARGDSSECWQLIRYELRKDYNIAMMLRCSFSQDVFIKSMKDICRIQPKALLEAVCRAIFEDKEIIEVDDRYTQTHDFTRNRLCLNWGLEVHSGRRRLPETNGVHVRDGSAGLFSPISCLVEAFVDLHAHGVSQAEFKNVLKDNTIVPSSKVAQQVLIYRVKKLEEIRMSTHETARYERVLASFELKGKTDLATFRKLDLAVCKACFKKMYEHPETAVDIGTTLYSMIDEHHRKQKTLIWLTIGVVLAVTVAFVLVYFFWVRRSQQVPVTETKSSPTAETSLNLSSGCSIDIVKPDVVVCIGEEQDRDLDVSRRDSVSFRRLSNELNAKVAAQDVKVSPRNSLSQRAAAIIQWRQWGGGYKYNDAREVHGLPALTDAQIMASTDGLTEDEKARIVGSIVEGDEERDLESQRCEPVVGTVRTTLGGIELAEISPQVVVEKFQLQEHELPPDAIRDSLYRDYILRTQELGVDLRAAHMALRTYLMKGKSAGNLVSKLMPQQ